MLVRRIANKSNLTQIHPWICFSRGIKTNTTLHNKLLQLFQSKVLQAHGNKSSIALLVNKVQELLKIKMADNEPLPDSEILPKIQKSFSLTENTSKPPRRILTLPPTDVKGMKILNKCAFDKELTVYGVVVPGTKLPSLLKTIAPIVMKMRKVKFTIDFPQKPEKGGENFKLVLLDPDIITSEECFRPYKNKFADKHGICLETLVKWPLIIGYENFNATETITAILPDGLPVNTAYDMQGHIAHMNLRDNLSEYKHIIGQVILDKMPALKTVVNKTSNIDNTYRNFEFELLAGVPEYKTTVKEHGFAFKFDSSKVFWNSRLATEHTRIVKMVNKGDNLFDVFAGVGPFAIPCAKKLARVYANDLNPSSYESLKQNVTLNKVKPEQISCFNIDGREFIKDILKKELLVLWNIEDEQLRFPIVSTRVHVVMNLPAIAVEFLDEFVGILHEYRNFRDRYPMHLRPIVHCYGFEKKGEKSLRTRAEQIMQTKLFIDKEGGVIYVRNVAPDKDMMRLDFTLTEEILFKAPLESNAANNSTTSTTTEIDNEKVCVEKEPVTVSTQEKEQTTIASDEEGNSESDTSEPETKKLRIAENVSTS